MRVVAYHWSAGLTVLSVHTAAPMFHPPVADADLDFRGSNPTSFSLAFLSLPPFPVLPPLSSCLLLFPSLALDALLLCRVKRGSLGNGGPGKFLHPQMPVGKFWCNSGLSVSNTDTSFLSIWNACFNTKYRKNLNESSGWNCRHSWKWN